MFNNIIVCAFIVLSTFPLHATFTLNFYDDSRVFSIFAVAAILAASCFSLIKHPNIVAKGTVIVALALCFTGLTITPLINQDPNSLLNSISVGLFILLAVNIKQAECKLKTMFFVIVCSSAALITKCYFYLVFSIAIAYLNDPLLLIEKFDNIRFFNQFQLFALVSSLALLKHNTFTKLAYYNLFSQLLFLFLTGGRGVTLSWLVLLALLAVAKPNRELAVTALKYTAAAFVAFLIANYLLTVNLGNVYLLRATSSLRAEMWLEALNALSWHNIFYGYGGGNYAAHTTLSPMSHPHNIVIQYISEWGAIFTLGFFGLVLIAISKNLPSLFNEKANYHAFVLLGFVAALANAQFDGTFHNPVGQFLSFTFLGLLLNSNYQTVRNGPGAGFITLSLLPRALLAILLLSLVVAYLVLCWYYFKQVQSNPTPLYHGPYFWLTGEPFKR